MRRMRAPIVVIVAVAEMTSLSAEPATKPATRRAGFDTWAFIENYRIAHYLELATELQKLDPDKRAAQLKQMADDRERASEVFPLCRMLFEAKPESEFRRPMIGAPHFVGRGDTKDWPLEPITLVDGAPILIVGGYSIGGHPEAPGEYVDYCLQNCKWRGSEFASKDAAKRKQIVEKFIAAHPKVENEAAEWLRRQAQ